jgi:chemotaxis protein CheX
MKVEYVYPFLASAISTFELMLKCTLTPREPFLRTPFEPDHEVSGVIGLSGHAKGAVVLSMCREAALSASEALLGERPKEIDRDVTDAVGELTNIIAGNAKAKLEHLGLSVSLPAVFVGSRHALELPHRTDPVYIPFDSPWGCVALEVELVEDEK